MKMVFFIMIYFLPIFILPIFANISEENNTLFDEAVSLYENGDNQAALEKIRLYLIDYPDDYKAKSNECAFLIELKQLSEAESCMVNLVSLNPDDSVNLTNLGVLYASRGDHNSAKIQFSIAHNLDPDNITILANLLATRVMLGDSSEAILKEHEELLSKDENSIQILVNIAKILNDNKNFDAAKIFLDRAYNLDEKHINTLTQLGVFYGLQNDFQNAEKYLLLGYEEDPGDIGILKNLGKLYSDLGDATNDIQYYKKSIEMYESALKIKPDNIEVKNGLDYSY